MNITKLNNSTPLAKIDLGNAFIVETYKETRHIVNLTNYYDCIKQIRTTVNSLLEEDSLIDSVLILKSKLSQLETKLDSFTPLNRRKRGLINGLGTLVKTISGNMDASDAKEIDDKFNNLKDNLNIVSDNLQLQNEFNNEILIRFENVTKHINHEQIAINNFITNSQNRIAKELNEEQNLLQKLQYINRIDYNIELLLNHLNDIIESLLLAKLNIIPKLILNKDEILKIKNIFQNQNLYVESDEELYSLLKLYTTYHNLNIIFNVKIPIFKKEQYKIARIIPLPINNTHFIVTPNYILYNNKSKIYPLREKCLNINNKFLCENVNSPTNQNTSCIESLLQEKTSFCDIQETNIITDIFEAEKGYIFIFNAKNTIIKTLNGNDISIVGSVIIKYFNCTLTINGIEYDNTINETIEKFDFFLPPIQKIIKNSTIEVLSLERLHLEAAHTSSRILDFRRQSTQHATTLYILFLLLAVTVVLFWTFRRNIHIVHLPMECQLPVVAPAIPSLWPSLHSRGGGVTNPAPTAAIPPLKPPRASA